MRTQSLRQAANLFLRQDRRGKYQDRKHRAYVIHKVIHDLYAIKKVPPSWQALTTDHIQNLVGYWKKQHINPTTIMRYMTIIRGFLPYVNCHLEHIDNKSLQLMRRYKHNKKIIPKNIWQTIPDADVRLIMALQIEFGLTFSEAIHIQPFVHVRDKHIWVTREIAFNAMDRTVPILTTAQKELLSQLNAITDAEKNLTELMGYDLIRIKWRQTMTTLRLPSRKSLRYLYAQQRFQNLLATKGHYKTFVMIKDEMGIKSRNTLWQYLTQMK
ncbi:MAG: integrase domain-containing protein [Legionellaceae bacterium]|nr:integrase domain-containing protein [Legionellaceae bacterium]